MCEQEKRLSNNVDIIHFIIIMGTLFEASRCHKLSLVKISNEIQQVLMCLQLNSSLLQI